jgi:hypothetical protein
MAQLADCARALQPSPLQSSNHRDSPGYVIRQNGGLQLPSTVNRLFNQHLFCYFRHP